MNELREWSEEGATREELAMLDAGRREAPGTGARTRALQALGVGVALTATTSAATSAAAGAATAGGVSLLTKIVGLGVIAGLVAGGMWRIARSEPPPSSAAVPAVPETSVVAAAPAPVVDAEEAQAAVPEESGERIEPDAPAAARSAATPAPSASLSKEVAALAGPHAKLADHDPDAALRELDAYRAKFPKGAMSSEETVLRVQALLARGDDAKAVALADAFCAKHPDSPYANRVRELVRKARKK